MALLASIHPWEWLRRVPLQILRFGRSGGGHAGGVLKIWVWYERLTTRHWDVKAMQPDGLLLYSLSTYRGQPLRLSDGTEIARGDRVVEIHLDNPAFSRLMATNRSPFVALRRSALDLRVLQQMIASGALGEVVAVHGLSLIGEATPWLGFETRECPRTPYWSLVRYFMVGLLVVYHPDGFERVRNLRDEVWPADLWMGAAPFAARYGPRQPRP